MATTEPARLSHDFIELYRSYKRKTKIAIAWLAETCKLDDISITALVTAAQSVKKRGIQVPSELYFVFKDALELRVCVAQQYKDARAAGSDDQKAASIAKHDFFISKFRLIFNTLFPKPPTGPPTKTWLAANATGSDKPTVDKSTNRFTSLAALATALEEDVITLSSAKEHLQASGSVSRKTPSAGDDSDGSNSEVSDDQDFDIGDPFEDVMVFLAYASECDALVSDAKKIWEKVGNNDYTSQLTSNVVRDLGIEDFQWLVDLHIDILTYFDSGELRDRYTPAKYAQFSDEGAFLHGVMRPLEAFLKQRTATNLSAKVIKPKDLVPFQNCSLPSMQCLPEPPPNRVDLLMNHISASCAASERINDDRSSCITTMLQDIDQLRMTILRNSGKRTIESVDYDTWTQHGLLDIHMSPLFSSLEPFIACNGEGFTAELNIWLTFLYESYNSFIWRGTNIASTGNARLQLLRHLKEVATSVNRVAFIVKSEDESERMDNLTEFSKTLDQLSAVPRWDLYSQAPFVNGMAMLEVNCQSMYLGINMWNDDGVAGFALHAYNLVLKKNILQPPIPILESLCTLLREAVFMGQRPHRNFRSALFRFMGGKRHVAGTPRRLENKRPGRPGMSFSEAGRKSFIDSPGRLPILIASNRRIQPEELSKIFALHESSYALGAALSMKKDGILNVKWKYKDQVDDKGEAVWGPGERLDSDKDYDEEDWTTHTGRNIMRICNNTFRAEVNKVDGTALPVTRINGFAVYLLFRDILARVWEKSAGGLSDVELAEHNRMGAKTHSRVSGRAGAIITTMMDFVDGDIGKSSVAYGTKHGGKSGGKLGLYKVKATNPNFMMEWVAEAILEAVEGKESEDEYLWKHL